MVVVVSKSDNFRLTSKCRNSFIDVYTCEHIADDHV